MKTLITSHSGAAGTKNNSLESVKYAIEIGADCFELDVRQGRNGELVLSHNALGNQPPCYLREAFEIQKRHSIAINCDIKEKDIALKTVELARSMGIDRDHLILSGSVTPTLLRTCASISDHAQIYLNIEELILDIYERNESSGENDFFSEIKTENRWEKLAEYDSDLVPYCNQIIKEYRALHADALNLPYNSITSSVFYDLYQAGIPLSVWTIDTLTDQEHYLRMHVKNLTTREPDTALAIRRCVDRKYGG